MENIFFQIGQFFPLYGSLRIPLIELLPQLSPYLKYQSLMPIQVGQSLPHLPDFSPQILDHNLQVGHMVVGQTLDLLEFADIQIPLLYLQL